MMETRLLHVRANVTDLNRAINWYEGVLNFRVAGVYPAEDPVYAQFSMQEGARFSIAVDPHAPSHGRYNFYVADVDGLWDELKEEAEVVEPLMDTPYGARKFTIRDPDGNELGFCRG